ncbi:MAG: thioredoxin family protein [Nannocystaceae bacterium]
MSQRHIEVFSAGCPACTETINLVNSIVCQSCSIDILDMHDKAVAARAKQLGIRSVPAVLIDGKLSDCCTGRGVDAVTLQAAGIGQPKV